MYLCIDTGFNLMHVYLIIVEWKFWTVCRGGFGGWVCSKFHRSSLPPRDETLIKPNHLMRYLEVFHHSIVQYSFNPLWFWLRINAKNLLIVVFIHCYCSGTLFLLRVQKYCKFCASWCFPSSWNQYTKDKMPMHFNSLHLMSLFGI